MHGSICEIERENFPMLKNYCSININSDSNIKSMLEFHTENCNCYIQHVLYYTYIVECEIIKLILKNKIAA